MERKTFSFLSWIILACFFMAIPLPCQAEENTELQKLVDDLRSLSEKSKDQRAADRWLQQALEDLVSKYDTTWRRELMFDEFSDGNFTENPAWNVISGEFWVDASLGLRSRVQPRRVETRDSTTEQRSTGSREDLGSALLGALVDQAFQRDEPRESRSRSEEDISRRAPARIRLGTEITNAFSLELVFSIHNGPSVEGHFQVALFQDQTGNYGYMLALYAGDEGIMDLYRFRRRQRELVSSSKLKTDIRSGERQKLLWRQG
ncbi:MAG: hypothetical protein R6U13_11605, partial [Desulfatiglandaceae bacterium]